MSVSQFDEASAPASSRPSIFQRFFAGLKRLFGRGAAAAASDRDGSSQTVPRSPGPNAADILPVTPRRSKSEAEGLKAPRRKTATFRTAILEELDRYFRYLKRMRASDPESFEFYKKVGAQVIAQHGDGPGFYVELPAHWKNVRPSFGCFLMTDHDKADRITPRFCYFRKFSKSPPGIQMVGAGIDVYRVTAHYDDDRDANAVFDFCVAIHPDNHCEILLARLSDPLTIRHRRRRAAEGRVTSVMRHTWGVPEFFEEWALEKGLTPRAAMLRCFFMIAQVWETTHMQMVEVRATRKGLTARFTIPSTEAIHLFRDREKPPGIRKNMFHAVRPHKRGDKMILMHFRGLRDFAWNGYKINIVIPLRETTHFLPDCPVPAIEYDTTDSYDETRHMDDAAFADLLVSTQTPEYAPTRH